jgi:hypothetical protein
MTYWDLMVVEQPASKYVVVVVAAVPLPPTKKKLEAVQLNIDCVLGNNLLKVVVADGKHLQQLVHLNILNSYSKQRSLHFVNFGWNWSPNLAPNWSSV